MKTLDLMEAAEFLKCSHDTLGPLAASGEIPGAKVGRAWVFVDVDLIEWLRAQYAPKQGKEKCGSTKSVKRGTTTFTTMDEEIDTLLE